MSNISRRINTIEKRLSLGQHKRPEQRPLILTLRSESEVKIEGQNNLGPVETWITYQEQLQAQQKANAEYLKNNPFGLPETIVIELDTGKEYQARGQQKAKQ